MKRKRRLGPRAYGCTAETFPDSISSRISESATRTSAIDCQRRACSFRSARPIAFSRSMGTDGTKSVSGRGSSLAIEAIKNGAVAPVKARRAVTIS